MYTCRLCDLHNFNTYIFTGKVIVVTCITKRMYEINLINLYVFLL